jgi:hypothetical protein
MARSWVVLAAVVAVVMAAAAFGAGYWVGSDGGKIRPSIYTGDGYAGADQTSLTVGETTYGFKSTVMWTDSDGSFHQDGWPECLPKVSEVKNVRFAAAVLWVEDIGSAQVIWVDCRGR